MLGDLFCLFWKFYFRYRVYREVFTRYLFWIYMGLQLECGFCYLFFCRSLESEFFLYFKYLVRGNNLNEDFIFIFLTRLIFFFILWCLFFNLKLYFKWFFISERMLRKMCYICLWLWIFWLVYCSSWFWSFLFVFCLFGQWVYIQRFLFGFQQIGKV